jgi:hypothetical protein
MHGEDWIGYSKRRHNEILLPVLRIAREMGIRTNNRQLHEILRDIERYIECARYTKVRNPTGVLTPWP